MKYYSLKKLKVEIESWLAYEAAQIGMKDHVASVIGKAMVGRWRSARVLFIKEVH